MKDFSNTVVINSCLLSNSPVRSLMVISGESISMTILFRVFKGHWTSRCPRHWIHRPFISIEPVYYILYDFRNKGVYLE